ncbi:MAG: sugar ABC transporter substrate-binding protein [Ktedonobacteraceae bacterium]|nr:sugar ABC transporter substrate-binding protein [Ktedonobacteraceae bacterium]
MLSRESAKGVFVSVFLVMCVFLVGCGGGAAQQSSSTSNGPINLTWSMWTASNPEVQAWEYDAALVTKKYPNIHIKFQTTTFPNYWTKLESEAASGTMPDIISLQSQHTPGFAANFLPLGSYIKQNNFDISAFDSTIVKGLTYQNEVRALPYDFGPLVIFYNKDLFKKYNVPAPTNSWTYAQFLDAAQKMSHGNDHGFIANPNLDGVLPFVLSDGGQYLTSDGKLNLNNSQFASTYQEYAKLAYQYHASPTLSVTESNNAAFLWASGNIGMIVDGPWDLINFKSSAKFSIGTVPVPALSKGQVTVTAGSGFGISTTTKNADAAWKAISVLTGPDAEQYLANSGRAFSARTAQQQYWYKNAVPDAESTLTYANARAVPEVTTASWNQAQTLFQQYGVKVVAGQQTAASALSTIQQQTGNS